ncbi:ABC-type dipeptide/oligopeptide/nickel transport system ATPase component [Mycobacterium frederiksbergense]|uniref:ABC-type dipeptide/oligopeptide/nickel transport system ATPase component n=1 Tax=Mycolicibacterium frederiksbergense TaxID=117567 RepID=A0ABT6L7A6_9MYCO|nr:ABC transporter ATP-binding protein [Mycolicibacterium frederiksbergense]MDH6198816.1 ABC-type dipeptide/oligopeptide/nickel transport system ATPase component [Mycolicibacterium frederiksbergense]
MSHLLEVDRLAVTMPDGTRAIDDVSFTVDRGEIVGFIGESGSGKSTTANAIARLLPEGATVTGRILFDDRNVLALGTRELNRFRDVDLGMVFQDPRAAVNPMARVGEYVTEALRVNRRMSRAAARARAVELFTEVGIPEPDRRLDEYPHQFSGGMLQRAVIAAALSTDPRLLLADEATTALDVTRQAEVAAILRRACRDRDLGLVFITHDLELAGALCDRICVMYRGRIVEQIEADRLHTDATHPYTIALLRSRPSVDGRPQRLPVITAADRETFESALEETSP